MVRRRCSTTLESGTKKRRWPSFSRLCSVGDDAPLVLTPEDRSLGFLPCPSPLREIEALYDALVDAFEADASLAPGRGGDDSRY